MTQLEVVYRCNTVPGEASLRALGNLREVYGVRRIIFNQGERTLCVEFDASRFKEPVMAGLLRRAGLDLGERLLPS
jgi:hypothetical protein